MSADLNIESTSQGTAAAYADRLVTKAPNWHGLVALDVLFNNLSTGLFLVAALGELVAPATFRALADVAYPIALLFLTGDLVCLVLDLGDPLAVPSHAQGVEAQLAHVAGDVVSHGVRRPAHGPGRDEPAARRRRRARRDSQAHTRCRGAARPWRGGVQGGAVQHQRPARVERCPLAGGLPEQLGADAGRRSRCFSWRA